jgi:hypothetical protein
MKLLLHTYQNFDRDLNERIAGILADLARPY